MIDLFGKRIALLNSSDPTTIGIKGTVMLESMKMIYLATPTGLKGFQKRGSVVRVEEEGNALIICDSMMGRVEDRLNRRGRKR
jgi:RNase P/RNase MRP subunit p29